MKSQKVSNFLWTPLIWNFRTLSMTLKLELELLKLTCTYLSFLQSNAIEKQRMRMLSVFWYIFNSTVGLHVSSADCDILYRGNQASYKISWKTQPKLWKKCTRTSESVMRPVSKHKRVTQHVGYNRSCHYRSKSLPWIVWSCSAMYKTTNTFNDKPLNLQVVCCCKKAWGRKMKKKKPIQIEMDLNNDIIGR